MLEKMLPAVTYMLALFFFLPKLPLFCLLVDMLVSSKEVILSTWILKYLKVWSMHRSNYERVTLIVMTWDGKCSSMFNNKACHLPCYNFLHWRKEGTMKSDNGKLVFLIPASIISFKSRKKSFLITVVCDFPTLLFFMYRVYDSKSVLPQVASCGAKSLVKWCLKEMFVGVPHHFVGFCSFCPSGSRS